MIKFHTFLQHKGSDLCMDIECPNCGVDEHVDSDFLYQWRCANCKVLYNVADFLILQKAVKGDNYFNRERYEKQKTKNN